MSDEPWSSAPSPPRLKGHEEFQGVDAIVVDFWKFAMSDLRMNNTRGYLAEFLVAKAVGATAARVEWDAYDVLSPDGIRIEVKTSAYLQSWAQQKPSRITFSGLMGRTWSPQAGYSETPTYNADVYVFCVQTARTHDEYDPLDVDQWMFYVAARPLVESLGSKSVSLTTVDRLTGGPVAFKSLDGAIRDAATPLRR